MAKSEGTLPRFDTNDVGVLFAAVHDKRNPRAVKEAALRRIREIERGIGKALVTGEYNGGGLKLVNDESKARPVTYSVSEMCRQDEEGWA